MLTADHMPPERPRWNAIPCALCRGRCNPGPYERLQASGFRVHRFFQYENWFATCSGRSFEGYYTRRPSQLRNTITRRRRSSKAHRSNPGGSRSGPDLSARRASSSRSMLQLETAGAISRSLRSLVVRRRCASCPGVRTPGGRGGAVLDRAHRRATIYKLAYDEVRRGSASARPVPECFASPSTKISSRRSIRRRQRNLQEGLDVVGSAIAGLEAFNRERHRPVPKHRSGQGHRQALSQTRVRPGRAAS